MIEGFVQDRSFALVPLELLRRSGERVRLEVLVDTGFTGGLTLPVELIRDLGLEFLDTTKAELANGVFIKSDVFVAQMHLA